MVKKKRILVNALMMATANITNEDAKMTIGAAIKFANLDANNVELFNKFNSLVPLDKAVTLAAFSVVGDGRLVPDMNGQDLSCIGLTPSRVRLFGMIDDNIELYKEIFDLVKRCKELFEATAEKGE